LPHLVGRLPVPAPSRRCHRGSALLSQSGSVCVNDMIVNFALTEVPMGGIKESAVCHLHGPDGIRKYCVKQAVVIDLFGMNIEINWWPITPTKVRLFRRALDLFGSGWRRKLLGAPART